MDIFMHWAAPALWALFWGYWAVAARSVKDTARAETPLSRGIHLGLQLLAFGLLLLPESFGLLTNRILPDTTAVYWIGLLVEAAGLGFAVWARVHLGRNWSGAVTIKADHKLIRSGPYAIVRHPIYTGLLVGLLGTAIIVGEARGLLAIAVLLAAYWRKLTIEERFLAGQFGDEYPAYQHEVKALIPFVL